MLNHLLNLIVQQTEEFSSPLAETMKGIVQETPPSSKRESDIEFEPEDGPTDDKETTDKEEKDMNISSVAEEIDYLENESEMPLKDLLNSLPPGYLDHKIETPVDSGSDIEADESSDDDESTLDEQEENEPVVDLKDEIEELEAEQHLPIEDLLKKYSDINSDEYQKADISALISADESEPEMSDSDSESKLVEGLINETPETEIESKDVGLEAMLGINDTDDSANTDDSAKERRTKLSEALELPEAFQPKGNTLAFDENQAHMMNKSRPQNSDARFCLQALSQYGSLQTSNPLSWNKNCVTCEFRSKFRIPSLESLSLRVLIESEDISSLESLLEHISSLDLPVEFYEKLMQHVLVKNHSVKNLLKIWPSKSISLTSVFRDHRLQCFSSINFATNLLSSFINLILEKESILVNILDIRGVVLNIVDIFSFLKKISDIRAEDSDLIYQISLDLSLKRSELGILISEEYMNLNVIFCGDSASKLQINLCHLKLDDSFNDIFIGSDIVYQTPSFRVTEDTYIPIGVKYYTGRDIVFNSHGVAHRERVSLSKCLSANVLESVIIQTQNLSTITNILDELKLQKFHNLKAVSIAKSCIDFNSCPVTADLFGRWIASLPCLQLLDLSSNKLRGYLNSWISNLKSGLLYLNLSECELTYDDLIHLSESIHSKSIIALEVSWVNFHINRSTYQEVNLADFVAAFQAQIVSLKLMGIDKMSAENLMNFSIVLQSCSALCSLWLDCWRFSRKEIIEAIQVLQLCKSLENLVLRVNDHAFNDAVCGVYLHPHHYHNISVPMISMTKENFRTVDETFFLRLAEVHNCCESLCNTDIIGL
ncbi:uncharacterized protein LOC136030104 [Artemia franciscana]|uniref:Uncharacterized protein n=1 Tax=Artemia franciscana TaxID=6661 RepID=A0AA88KVW0_ARTSF|nr:hypothetical protein QYM36_015817 [Artemia franciscana]